MPDQTQVLSNSVLRATLHGMSLDSAERQAYEALLNILPDVSDFPDMRRRLAQGEELSDRDFDRIFPESVQSHSRIHWTPVAVARRACQFLVPTAGRRVLDVGAGVGKFCLLGGLLSEGEFVGMEQRSEFTRVARQVASRYRIARVSFFHANARDIDWSDFESLYLYNPFCEARYPQRQIDLDLPSGPAVFRDYVKMARGQLRRLKTGTRVALYHGFGGRMPETFEAEFSEPCGSGRLEGWIKVR